MSQKIEKFPPSGEVWLKEKYNNIIIYIRNNQKHIYSVDYDIDDYHARKELIYTLCLEFGLTYRSMREYVDTLIGSNKIKIVPNVNKKGWIVKVQ
jgi:hypothetical protein